jgi:hypothetical protein
MPMLSSGCHCDAARERTGDGGGGDGGGEGGSTHVWCEAASAPVATLPGPMPEQGAQSVPSPSLS